MGAVDHSITTDDLPVQFGDDVIAMHFGSISLVLEPGATALEALMKRESRRRILTLDPNIHPAVIFNKEAYKQGFTKWISLVDILRLSQVDMEYLYPDKCIEELLPEWFGAGVGLIILTQGAKGSRGYLPNGINVLVQAQKIAVKDTIGAGDTFFSAALAYLFDHEKLSHRTLVSRMTAEELKACLTFAAKAAAINCTREGADPPYIKMKCIYRQLPFFE